MTKLKKKYAALYIFNSGTGFIQYSDLLAVFQNDCNRLLEIKEIRVYDNSDLSLVNILKKSTNLKSTNYETNTNESSSNFRTNKRTFEAIRNNSVPFRYSAVIIGSRYDYKYHHNILPLK